MVEKLSIENVADLVKSQVLKSGIEKWDLYILNGQINSLYLRKSKRKFKVETELKDSRHNLSYVLRYFKINQIIKWHAV